MSVTINFQTDDGDVLFVKDKINAAEIKDDTIKVWLNSHTPYVFNYKNKEMAKKNFAKLSEYLNDTLEVKEVDEEYNGKAMLHVLEKGVKQGKRELIDKACEWLINNVGHYSTNTLGAEYMCEDFRKAMEK